VLTIRNVFKCCCATRFSWAYHIVTYHTVALMYVRPNKVCHTVYTMCVYFGYERTTELAWPLLWLWYQFEFFTTPISFKRE